MVDTALANLVGKGSILNRVYHAREHKCAHEGGQAVIRWNLWQASKLNRQTKHYFKNSNEDSRYCGGVAENTEDKVGCIPKIINGGVFALYTFSSI